MLVKALTDKYRMECFLNTDYIVEICPDNDGYLAYTPYSGYFLTAEEFEKIKKAMNESEG